MYIWCYFHVKVLIVLCDRVPIMGLHVKYKLNIPFILKVSNVVHKQGNRSK
jgi:hypothetical protein